MTTTTLPILNEREQAVAALVVEGLQDKEIAARLNVSLRMAKWAVQTAMARTGSLNRVGLAVWYVRATEVDGRKVTA